MKRKSIATEAGSRMIEEQGTDHSSWAAQRKREHKRWLTGIGKGQCERMGSGRRGRFRSKLPGVYVLFLAENFKEEGESA